VKAFELHPEEGFDALQLVDRPRPAVGPGEVRVRVRAVSLNYRDLMVARGSRKRARRIVPASDGAGEGVARPVRCCGADDFDDDSDRLPSAID